MNPSLLGFGTSSARIWNSRSEEHTSELQSQSNLVCRLLLEKKTNLDQTVRLQPRQTLAPIQHVRTQMHDIDILAPRSLRPSHSLSCFPRPIVRTAAQPDLV